jgi:hypothetical protein
LAEKVSYKFNLLIPIYRKNRKERKKNKKNSDKKLMRGKSEIEEWDKEWDKMIPEN